jgi:hypothetical protein
MNACFADTYFFLALLFENDEQAGFNVMMK